MKYILIALACAASTPAIAQTYANANDSDTIGSFGAPDTTSYGQVFTAPGGTLSSWTFYDTDSTDNGARLVVAAWDGAKPVGPALYSNLSQSVSTDGGFFSHTYSGINLSLTSGTSYIAYLTVAGVDNPTSGNGVAGSGSSPLDGGFRYLNSGGTDPLDLDWAWSVYDVPNMQYTAVFAPGSAPVPEPASWALMLGGFGLVGGAMRSRRKTAVAFG